MFARSILNRVTGQYKKINELFINTPDSHEIGTRKSVILKGWKLGYIANNVLVYPKASLRKVRIGSSAIPYGWTVIDKVYEPGERDGYVVCIQSVI